MKTRILAHSKIALVFLSTLTLCSCLSPVKTANINTYILEGTPHVPQSRIHASTLLVLTPDTRPVYNTVQMAYSIKPYEVSYFSQNQWAETPGQMLLPLLVQSLQNTHAFRAVVPPSFVGNYNYVLNTQVITFEQDFTQHPALLRLTVRAQLSRAAGNRIVATKLFKITDPLYQRGPYGGVLAANRATERLLREIAQFCIANT